MPQGFIESMPERTSNMIKRAQPDRGFRHRSLPGGQDGHVCPDYSH